MTKTVEFFWTLPELSTRWFATEAEARAERRELALLGYNIGEPEQYCYIDGEGPFSAEAGRAASYPEYVPGVTWPTEYCGEVWAADWAKYKKEDK